MDDFLTYADHLEGEVAIFFLALSETLSSGSEFEVSSGRDPVVGKVSSSGKVRAEGSVSVFSDYSDIDVEMDVLLGMTVFDDSPVRVNSVSVEATSSDGYGGTSDFYDSLSLGSVDLDTAVDHVLYLITGILDKAFRESSSDFDDDLWY